MSNNIGSLPPPDSGKSPNLSKGEDLSIEKMLKKHGISPTIESLYVNLINSSKADAQQADKTQKKNNAKIQNQG